MSRIFHGKVALQQRVLPFYRAPFFDLLAESCTAGLDVFAGEPRSSESIESARRLEIARFHHAENIHFLSGAAYLCWQRNLLDWLDAVNPDALIMEANPRYLASPAAIRRMHRQGKPVIGWGLGAPALQGVEALLRATSRGRFIRSFDGMIAYSDSGAQEYIREGIPAERIFVAPNAVARSRQGVSPSRKAPVGKANLLYVGRLQPRKRLDLLMQACSMLPENLQPGLTIIGDGPERQRLEEFAHTVYPAAVFTGTLMGEALEPFFQRADLFVLPGTGGLAVQQAMSHALPVIVAEGDGTQTDLVRESNGWHIVPGDLADLQRTLLEALSQPEKLPDLGRESFRIVCEEINLEKMADVFLLAIQAVSAK